MQIDPGELNKKISIYTKASGTDADGFPTAPERWFCLAGQR
jgi:hypothetical protein